ncbi:hypothetical protein [Nocardioides pakistanensis]
MSTCPKTQKVIHASKDDARAAIASLYRAGRGNPDYRPYPCRETADGPVHWHVGHSRVALAKRVRRALRRL